LLQFLLLMLEFAARRKLHPIDGVHLILISGARWMRDRTPALQALFPNARIVEFYGASETSFMAWMDADGNFSDNNDHKCFPIPLYTYPPQRTEQESVADDFFRMIADRNPKPFPPPQRTEQNFCSRCGKRTADLTTIHTCTPPPQENT
jgi:acyl-CoA synthetase (AMP-forming)/AMP-acid ligase II